MDYYKALEFVNEINNYIPGLYVVGSIRRKEQLIKDVDFITKRVLEDVIDDFSLYYGDKMTIVKEGKKYGQIKVKDEYYKEGSIKIDIWATETPTEFKFTRWLRSMDKGHVIGLCRKAELQGMRLSTKGLYDEGRLIPVKTLTELKQILL